jgi:inositol phosphorylceramide mannosyltransferase catalytic subunit
MKPAEAVLPHNSRLVDCVQNLIPKRIIQTGKDSEHSLRTRAMLGTIKNLNPDYEYLFFDDRDVGAFIDREFPQYREIFESFPFDIQRYDFFRYLAVYRHGGFYFDLDVLLATGLSPLLQCGCVFPFEGLTISHFLREQHKMDWEIGNYAFGAAPDHPFLEAVIENCVKAQTNPNWVKPMLRGAPLILRSEYIVLNTTGPGLLSRTFAENPEFATSVTVLFPDDVCDEDKWNCFGDFGVHLMEGSWRSKGRRIRTRLAQRWEYWESRRLLKQSRLLGKTRPCTQ